MTLSVQIRKAKKTFRVGFFRRKVEAVRDVSFEVEKGEIFGIVGPNGAGKTTTLKMLTGLVRPESGTLLIDGQDVREVRTRRKLGYLPENPYFYEHLTIDELLRFYGQLYGLERAVLRRRVPELIERVGLVHARDRKISKYSKGMRQRAGLAQALIDDPELVILDEPQTGLDPFGRKDVRDLIFSLKEEGKTVLFSSHILPDVEAVCDRVVLINKGTVLEVGTLQELTGQRVKGFEIIATNVQTIPAMAREVHTQAGSTFLEVSTEADLQRCLSELLQQKAGVSDVTTRRENLEDVLARDVKEVEP